MKAKINSVSLVFTRAKNMTNTYNSGDASTEAGDSIFPATGFHLNIAKQLQQLRARCLACGIFQHSNGLCPHQDKELIFAHKASVETGNYRLIIAQFVPEA